MRTRCCLRQPKAGTRRSSCNRPGARAPIGLGTFGRGGCALVSIVPADAATVRHGQERTHATDYGRLGSMSRPHHTAEQTVGCLLGLALGDAFGAPHEGGPLERGVWRLIGRTRQGKLRWTDDTAMALALAESVVAKGCVDQDDLAGRFAADYAWSRGYGPGTARILKAVRRGTHWQAATNAVYPGGSYGNGAAMRAPVLALAYCNGGLVGETIAAAQVTHAHELAVAGAVAVASAVEGVLGGLTALETVQLVCSRVTHTAYTPRLRTLVDWLSGGADRTPVAIRGALGNGVAALDSCATAIYVGLVHGNRSFDELLEMAIAVGGDVDTIGAMAGSLWGARNGRGAIPGSKLDALEDVQRIEAAARGIHARFVSPSRD